MNNTTIVREINGMKGFCIYNKGIPYTYIYTRDVIEILGMTRIVNNKMYLRINGFGERFDAIVQEEKIASLPVQLGINLTENFKISQVSTIYDMTLTNDCQSHTDSLTIGCQSKSPWRPSVYDDILPEYIVDRVIFAIANTLTNKIAREFRYELFNTIVPYFQQTANQDQINNIPILKQINQFMYDSTSYSTVTQQQALFAKQSFDMFVNRLGILTNAPTMDDAIVLAFSEFDNFLLNNKDISLHELSTRYIETVNKFLGSSIKEYSIIDTVNAILSNRRIYILFIGFIANFIRNLEAEQINNAYKKEKQNLKPCPVQFLSIEDKADFENIGKDRSKTFENLINWNNINE